MLNFLASLAFYGSFVAYAFVTVGLFFCAKWIVQAIALNARANRQAARYLNAPMTSNVSPWGRKAGR